MSKKSFIDSVEVNQPCTESWNEMSGNHLVRFCSHCSKDVNNLSEMTRKQATRLVAASDGRLCIRYKVDPVTRKPIFADKLVQIARRSPRLAAGILGTSITLSAQAYAQEPIVERIPPTSTAASGLATTESVPARSSGKIYGVVVDPNGAVIIGAEVRATSITAGVSVVSKSDADGVYNFENLAEGRYQVEVSAAGFDAVTKTILVSDTEVETNIKLGLSVLADVTVGGNDNISTALMGTSMVSVTRYYTPLESAIISGNLDEARDVISRGFGVNQKQKTTGLTPLFLAVEYGDVKMVELLLTSRSKVNARDNAKQTPIMALDEDATPELVRLLTRFGAKLKVVDSDGTTPLIKAAEKTKPEVLEALIREGSDVNVADKSGRTALMAAAADGNIGRVRVLLEAGARVNAKNDEGETAWDLADSDEVEKLLETYGGTSGTPDTEKPASEAG